MQSNNDEDDADEVFLRMRADTHWKERVIREQVAVKPYCKRKLLQTSLPSPDFPREAAPA